MPEVTFCGKTLRVPDDVGIMPLMRFAKEARFGLSYADVEGLAAMHDLLEGCIDSEDWPLFNQLADENRATGDQLWQLVQDVFAAISERPTAQPSDSSPGSSGGEARSTDDSYLQVKQEYEAKGRPDLALLVQQTHEALSA